VVLLGLRLRPHRRADRCGDLPVERVITSSVALDGALMPLRCSPSGTADEIKVLVEQLRREIT
jgi:hypothetical protein